jgi:hypothetical protein
MMLQQLNMYGWRGWRPSWTMIVCGVLCSTAHMCCAVCHTCAVGCGLGMVEVQGWSEDLAVSLCPLGFVVAAPVFG